MTLLMTEKIDNCDLCGKDVTSNGKVIAKGIFDRYGIKSEIYIVMCGYCKYIFQYQRFDRGTLSILYKQDSIALCSHIPDKDNMYMDNLKKRKDFITKAIKISGLTHEKELHILDVGGGIGEVTEHLAGLSKVHVVDVSVKDPINQYITKTKKLFDEAQFTKKFDIIVMNHVLEHIFSPMEFLRKANQELTSQGIVIIEVPFELYTPFFFKRIGDWKHVAYFSTSVLRNFLHKANFDPLYLKLTTGYYEARRLAVIRAVARKMPHSSGQPDCKSSYVNLFRDSFNANALFPYLLTQFRKILP